MQETIKTSATLRIVDRSPIHYSWIVLLAGTVGIMMTVPGQTLGVSVFLDKIIADLGLSRAYVSTMYSLATLLGSFALPWIGKFIDRRGPRIAVTIIAACFAAACVAMGFVAGAVSLFIGFVFIRGLGQGALGLVSLNVINIWFVRRRGLAIGLSGIGMAIATAFFPQLIEFLISTWDWRVAYMLLGLMVAVIMIPVGAGLFRWQPERYGLRPDAASAAEGDDAPAEATYTARAARRTITFWLFAAGGMFISGLGTGLMFHHYSIMHENGLSRLDAAVMFIPFGFIMAGANVVTGLLLDRVPPRFLLSVSLLFLSAALLFAPQVDSRMLVIVYGVVIGMMQGMQGAIQAVVYAHYFGRKHFGAIKGFASTLMVTGTAVGPILFAFGLDWFGSYSTIFAISAIGPCAVAIVAPFLKLKRAGQGCR